MSLKVAHHNIVHLAAIYLLRNAYIITQRIGRARDVSQAIRTLGRLNRLQAMFKQFVAVVRPPRTAGHHPHCPRPDEFVRPEAPPLCGSFIRGHCSQSPSFLIGRVEATVQLLCARTEWPRSAREQQYLRQAPYVSPPSALPRGTTVAGCDTCPSEGPSLALC